MAQSIISKEELLENAYEIAEEGGVSALSIRGLATKSGVSVGTVYRFFAAKDELTIATIELYFARAFYKEFCHLDAHTAFVDYCEKMNVSMHQVFNHFREYWLRGAEALPSAEKGLQHACAVAADRARSKTASSKSTNTTRTSLPIARRLHSAKCV